MWRTFCPAHDDSKSPSLAVKDNGKGGILVHCHAGCAQDKVIGALRAQKLWPGRDEYETWQLAERHKDLRVPSSFIRHPEYKLPVRAWTYRDLDGSDIGQVYRFEPAPGEKVLLPVNWCISSKGRREWRFKGFKNPRPLYRLDELTKRPEAPVLIVEGEKSADAAALLFPDYVAMTFQGGSKSVRYADVGPLKGREVILWPDHDDPGLKAMAAMAELLRGVAKRCRMVAVPPDFPVGWDVADEIPREVSLRDILLNALEYTPASENVIEDMNRRYALALVGDKAVVIEEQVVPSGKIVPRYLSIQAFNAYHSNRLIPVGRKDVPISKYWLEHEDRRSYEGIIFRPGQETPSFYNLWRGFSIEPDQTGDCSMFLEHLKENVTRGDEGLYRWVMSWFAQVFQQPTVKPGTSLAIRGKQGTGKTIVGKVMGHLIRAHYVLVDDPKHVYGSFNQHLVNALLLHADEGFWAGDAKHIGKLKGLVTADTQRIEPKGKDTFEVDSFIRLLTTSNDSFIVPAGFEERRFCVLDIGTGRMQDHEYFAQMQRQLNNGGYGRLLHELLHWDLNSADVWKVPSTIALAEQKQESMNNVLKFWFDLLLAGHIGTSSGWPAAVLKDELYQLYIRSAQERGDRYRASKVDFGRKLSEVHPDGKFHEVRIKATSYDQRSGIAVERREWGYKLGDLRKFRAHFDTLLGQPTGWPAIDDDEKTDTAPF